ncbi:MAG TPA: hypothetical protein PLP70_01695 [bacterium]|jgi:heme O synthase-like polyprenyltransferase|nr:hypothetical protein [bacterium]HQB26549.1 hypothetical protein [bacterium]
MKKSNLAVSGLLNAFLAVAYISLVAVIMSNGDKIFGSGPDTFVAPIIFLLIFVISAAVTGYLIIGRPALLYLDNQKSEARKLFKFTVLFLILFALVAWGLNFLVS